MICSCIPKGSPFPPAPPLPGHTLHGSTFIVKLQITFFWHIQIDFLETLYSKLDSSHIRWWFWNAIPIRFLQMHLGPDVLAADLRFQSVFFIFLFTWTVPPRRCQIQSDGSATEQPLSSNMEDNTENSRQWTDTEIHFLLSLCGEASKCFHVGKAASPA